MYVSQNQFTYLSNVTRLLQDLKISNGNWSEITDKLSYIIKGTTVSNWKPT